MKRTNVILDEELLEEARRVTGERTYSATIQKALEEIVREKRLKELLDATWNLGDDIFWPGWLEEQGFKKPTKQRRSADEKRAPRKKSKQVTRRGTR